VPFADVCSRMLTYAHVCSRMLTYAHVCHWALGEQVGLGTSVTPRGGGAGGEGAGGGGGGQGRGGGIVPPLALDALLRYAYVSIRQVCIRQHTSRLALDALLRYADVCCLGILQMLTCRMLMYADAC
jgi:hypothetical protein